MNKPIALGCLTAALLWALAATSQSAEPTNNAQLGRLRHVVLFAFKEGTTPEQVKTIEDAFRALPGKIPTIVDFEWGTDVSVENLADGFTHCFLVSFKDAEGRKAYLPHPAHLAFVAVLKPHLEKVLVIDFVAKD